jgi:hypothetical protein
MPSQQSIQQIWGIAKACALQTFNRLTQSDKAASCCKVENTECAGNREAPTPGKVNAVTVIDNQEFRSNPNREQDRCAFAVVQA